MYYSLTLVTFGGVEMSYETARHLVRLEVIAIKCGGFIEWRYRRPGFHKDRFFFTRVVVWSDENISISHPFTRVVMTLCFPSKDIYAFPVAICDGEYEVPCFQNTNDCRRYYSASPT